MVIPKHGIYGIFVNIPFFWIVYFSINLQNFHVLATIAMIVKTNLRLMLRIYSIFIKNSRDVTKIFQTPKLSIFSEIQQKKYSIDGMKKNISL